MFSDRSAKLLLRADEQYFNFVLTRRQNCAFDLRLRRLVGTHRVEGDNGWHESSSQQPVVGSQFSRPVLATSYWLL
jgi:hypothetical protein